MPMVQKLTGISSDLGARTSVAEDVVVALVDVALGCGFCKV